MALLLSCGASLAFVAAVGCGGNDETKTPFALNETEYAMDWYDQFQLTAEGATDVLWSSSNESIATVDENGLVVAQGESGNVTITATSGTKKAECLIRIRDWDIDPLFKGEEILAFVGALTTPTVYADYAETTFAPDSVTYQSTDENIAIVENGQIKGVSVGETEISVSLVWKGCEIEGTLKAVFYP